jgi:hypothetical protein
MFCKNGPPLTVFRYLAGSKSASVRQFDPNSMTDRNRIYRPVFLEKSSNSRSQFWPTMPLISSTDNDVQPHVVAVVAFRRQHKSTAVSSIPVPQRRLNPTVVPYLPKRRSCTPLASGFHDIYSDKQTHRCEQRHQFIYYLLHHKGMNSLVVIVVAAHSRRPLSTDVHSRTCVF